MRFLTLSEVLELHGRVIDQTGGANSVHDLGAIESAVYQPQMTFDGTELYPTLPAKAGALCFSLVMNHGFVDGNKRIGHAAMEIFLVINGWALAAGIDDAEQTILSLAAGNLQRDQLVAWISSHIRPVQTCADDSQ
jgi:death on curing protein